MPRSGEVQNGPCPPDCCRPFRSRRAHGMENTQGPTVRRYMLGRRLRALRDQAGMTAVQAAAHLDLTQPTITRIEKGRNAILVRNVKQLCQLYRVEAPLLDTLVRLARESDGVDWFAVYGDTVP